MLLYINIPVILVSFVIWRLSLCTLDTHGKAAPYASGSHAKSAEANSANE